MSKKENAIEMFVAGLLYDQSSQKPVVVLKNETGSVNLPIWIGESEAISIGSAIKQYQWGRPLTHDLICNILGELGILIQRMVITELKDGTYYADIFLSKGEEVIILDARPSDAIALVIRASAPIFVTERVLELAKQSFLENVPGTTSTEEEETGEQEPSEGKELNEGRASDEVEGEDNNASNPLSYGFDFQKISKDKWDEFLHSIDPKGFKHKM